MAGVGGVRIDKNDLKKLMKDKGEKAAPVKEKEPLTLKDKLVRAVTLLIVIVYFVLLFFGKYFIEGDNLYLKGACLIAEKFAEGKQSDERIFDGSESLKASLTIDASDRGKPAVLTLLKAGENRFYAGTECELILGDVSFLLFVLTSYPEGKRRTVRMDLDGSTGKGKAENDETQAFKP